MLGGQSWGIVAGGLCSFRLDIGAGSLERPAHLPTTWRSRCEGGLVGWQRARRTDPTAMFKSLIDRGVFAS